MSAKYEALVRLPGQAMAKFPKPGLEIPPRPSSKFPPKSTSRFPPRASSDSKFPPKRRSGFPPKKHMASIPELLRTGHVIAVVGLSSDEMRPSYGVAAYLKRAGYRIIPVNPNENGSAGRESLTRASEQTFRKKIDIVTTYFVDPCSVRGVVESAIKVGAKAVWMQEGVVDAIGSRASSGAAGLDCRHGSLHPERSCSPQILESLSPAASIICTRHSSSRAKETMYSCVIKRSVISSRHSRSATARVQSSKLSSAPSGYCACDPRRCGQINGRASEHF